MSKVVFMFTFKYLDVNLNLNATVDLNARLCCARGHSLEEFDVSGSWISVKSSLMPTAAAALPGAVKVDVQGGVHVHVQVNVNAN